VHALIDTGLVRGSPPDRLRAGPLLIGVALASGRELRREIAPMLEELSRSLQETVALAVLDGGDALLVEQFPSPRPLRVVSEVGVRFPLHCTAAGKALLAALSPTEAEALLPPVLKRFTDATVTSRRNLLTEIELIRQTGLARDSEEHTPGMSSLASSVALGTGPPVPIAVLFPSIRFAEDEKRTGSVLLESRDQLSRPWIAV